MDPHNDQFETSQMLGNVRRVTRQVYRLFCPFKPFWFFSEKLFIQLWTPVLCHLYLFCSSDRSACRKSLRRGQGALNMTSYLIDDFEIIQLVFEPIWCCSVSNLCLTELFPFASKIAQKFEQKFDTVFFRKLAKFSRWLRQRHIAMHVSSFNVIVSLNFVPIRATWLQNGAELCNKWFWKSVCVNYKFTMFQETMKIPNGRKNWNNFAYTS